MKICEIGIMRIFSKYLEIEFLNNIKNEQTKYEKVVWSIK